MSTTAEILAEVETAISSTLTAQSYTAAGRSKQMASLATLFAVRRELKEELSNSSNGGGSMISLLRLEDAS